MWQAIRRSLKTVLYLVLSVNGPGEAAGADRGVSLGRGRAHVFKRGEIVGTVDQDQIAEAVIDLLDRWDDDAPPAT